MAIRAGTAKPHAPHETARRLLQNLSRIFRYAISNDQAEHDHADDLRGAFTPVKGRHYSAISMRYRSRSTRALSMRSPRGR